MPTDHPGSPVPSVSDLRLALDKARSLTSTIAGELVLAASRNPEGPLTMTRIAQLVTAMHHRDLAVERLAYTEARRVVEGVPTSDGPGCPRFGGDVKRDILTALAGLTTTETGR